LVATIGTGRASACACPGSTKFSCTLCTASIMPLIATWLVT